MTKLLIVSCKLGIPEKILLWFMVEYRLYHIARKKD